MPDYVKEGKIRFTEDLPEDRATETVRGTVVPVTGQYGGLRNGGRFEPVEVLEIETSDDGEKVTKVGPFDGTHHKPTIVTQGKPGRRKSRRIPKEVPEFDEEDLDIYEEPVERRKEGVVVSMTGSFGTAEMEVDDIIESRDLVVLMFKDRPVTYRPPAGPDIFEMDYRGMVKKVYYANLFFTVADRKETYVLYHMERN
jgi:hypothetical protein